MDEWIYVERIDVQVQGIDERAAGLLDVRIALNRRPEPEWASAFENPTGVSMSMSMHPPGLEGDTVRIRPPDDQLEKYVQHVDDRIDAANILYVEQVLPRLRTAEEARQREATEQQRRLEEARHRAEKL